MDMGSIIKQLRKEKGLTQDQLGEIIGVQRSTINKYEKGFVKNMKRSSIKKMADYFGVSPSYLLGYEDSSVINNGIIGNNNNHNVVSVGKEALGEIETELLSLCGKMSIQQKTKLLTYAYDLMED